MVLVGSRPQELNEHAKHLRGIDDRCQMVSDGARGVDDVLDSPHGRITTTQAVVPKALGKSGCSVANGVSFNM